MKMNSNYVNVYKNDAYDLPKNSTQDGDAVPCLYLVKILSMLIAQTGYRLNENWFENFSFL
jgi:hypothetical protein